MTKRTTYQNRKKGRQATIEVEADVWIDEYLEYASDEAIVLEMVERGLTVGEGEVNAEILADAFCAKLSIIKAQALRDLLVEFMKP